MRTRFIGQPFSDWTQIGKALEAALALDDRDSLWLAVAWAKSSGVRRLELAIHEFRNRGARTEAIIGVDEGGATEEGLRLAMELFESAFVFHDPGTRTFHPKFYVVEVVGSRNATKGGLYQNFEVAVVIELDFAVAGDCSFLDEVRRYFDALKADPQYCRRLDGDLVDSLLEDPDVRVVPGKRSGGRRVF